MTMSYAPAVIDPEVRAAPGAVRGAACRAVSAAASRPSSRCMGRVEQAPSVARGIRGEGPRTWGIVTTWLA